MGPATELLELKLTAVREHTRRGGQIAVAPHERNQVTQLDSAGQGLYWMHRICGKTHTQAMTAARGGDYQSVHRRHNSQLYGDHTSYTA